MSLPAHGDHMRPSRDWSSTAPGPAATGSVELPDADPRPTSAQQYVACSMCILREIEPSVHTVYTILDGASVCVPHARERLADGPQRAT